MMPFGRNRYGRFLQSRHGKSARSAYGKAVVIECLREGPVTFQGLRDRAAGRFEPTALRTGLRTAVDSGEAVKRSDGAYELTDEGWTAPTTGGMTFAEFMHAFINFR